MRKILENICNGTSGLGIKRWFQISIVPALILIALPVNATIIGSTSVVTGGTAFTIDGGAFFKLTTPLSGSTPLNSVGDNNFQDSNLYGFDEDQNILLGAPLSVDIGTSPTTGDYVASHYIFFDPSANRKIIGTVDFDSAVLGIITSKTNLDASDFLADTGVNYLSPGLRGLESADSVWISGTNPNQIGLDFTANSPGDYIRVLTTFSPQAAVPEPSTVILLGIGLAGLGGGFLRRRQKQKLIKDC